MLSESLPVNVCCARRCCADADDEQRNQEFGIRNEECAQDFLAPIPHSEFLIPEFTITQSRPSFFSSATVLGWASSIGGSKPSESAPAGAAALPLPTVDPNIAADQRREAARVLHADAGAALDEELNDGVVAERRRDVQRGVAGLARRVHVAAQATAAATASRTRLSGSTLPKSMVSMPRRLAVRLDPIPAASITASAPFGIVAADRRLQPRAPA